MLSSSTGTLTVIVTVLVGVIIVLGLVGYSYYATSSSLSSLSEQNSNLGQQLSNLNQQDSNLNQQVSNQNQQVSSLNQQIANGNQLISSLSQQVSTLEQNTLTTVTLTNTLVNVEITTSVVTTTQTSLVTTTQTSRVTTTQTSIGAVPQATLVITGDSYDNTTHTFTFQVQNTQNYTVYAQLSASLWGQTSFGCNGQAGTFISQVYTFKPSAVTTTQLSLSLGTYVGFCGGNPLSSIEANFVIPQSTAVSPTYTFIIVPNYTFA
jgi:hypothetical protein